MKKVVKSDKKIALYSLFMMMIWALLMVVIDTNDTTLLLIFCFAFVFTFGVGILPAYRLWANGLKLQTIAEDQQDEEYTKTV
ncbi:hypothetical protein [Bacillus cereus]|uniref:hypothetical protein n=1 Tax=Bacillus cereus TaxID=1396 RepID=UPI000B4BAF06|nr:hypothetical protein [Bacillus cereus]